MKNIRVKLSIPGAGENPDISEFLDGKANQGFGCQFYVNDSSVKDVDCWFVLDDLQTLSETAIVDKNNVFFLNSEIVYEKGYYDNPQLQNYLDQFSEIYTCYDIYRQNVKFTLPFLGWMINSNHGNAVSEKKHHDLNWLRENNILEKNKKISVFCSDQQATIDHRIRLKFVRNLKEHFGCELDWYGNGINPLPDKWTGIAPYKYHIALENQSRNHIITEKLYDSFLGLAFPIYYGAPDVGKFFNIESLQKIDLMDLNGSIKKIEKILEIDPWDEKLSLLIDSKSKVLNEFNVFNRISKIAHESVLNSHNTKQTIKLFSTKFFKYNIGINSLRYLAGKGLQRIAIKLIK